MSCESVFYSITNLKMPLSDTAVSQQEKDPGSSPLYLYATLPQKKKRGDTVEQFITEQPSSKGSNMFLDMNYSIKMLTLFWNFV